MDGPNFKLVKRPYYNVGPAVTYINTLHLL